MKPYRFKHKPTGLYYVPSRGVKVKSSKGFSWKVKSNLSKSGKVYFSKQNPIAGIKNHLKFTEETNGFPRTFYEACGPDDFEIEYL